jgi:RNA polymerase sigma-70 factor (ECF subfamily)
MMNVDASRDASFADLMARLRTGDDDAAAQVFHRFANRLVGLARVRLDGKIRQKMDPEDLLQSVFQSFFARYAAGQITDLESWDNLWAMLVVITLRKCGRRIDYFHAGRRDVRREVSVEPPSDQSDVDWDASAAEPTPLEAAMLAEVVERLLGSFEGRHRQILALSLQGCPVPEISTQVGCTERTVYRVLERATEWLELTGGEDDPKDSA